MRISCWLMLGEEERQFEEGDSMLMSGEEERCMSWSNASVQCGYHSSMNYGHSELKMQIPSLVNVFVSRYQGSQEISKHKVGSVFLDTLYNYIQWENFNLYIAKK